MGDDSDLPAPGEWRDLDEAPPWRWLLGWTNHGYRIVMNLTADPPHGIPPQRPGWCTTASYGAHLFFNEPGRHEPRDLVIFKWTTFPIEPPPGLNTPGIPVSQPERFGIFGEPIPAAGRG